MSEEKNMLDGEWVTLYLSGGHIVGGRVESSSDKEVVIVNDTGIMIASRDMISGIMVTHSETNTEDRIEPVIASAYHDIEAKPEEVEEYYQPESNELGQGNHYGSVLPADMLIGEDDEPQVDFAVTMSSLRNPPPYKKEEDDDSDKEA
jgi:hypothetical protein